MKWSACLPRLLALGLLALGAGCGGEHDAMEKQLAELRGEISRLRAGQAAIGERLDAIDIERGAFAKGAAAAPPLGEVPRGPATASLAAPRPVDPSAGRPKTPSDDRPQLDVVRLSPNEGDGDVDSDPSRPVVRVIGDGAGPRATLTNKSLGARPAPKRGVAPAAPKKQADGDVRPGAKP
jgi:hypothetical protein